MKKKLIALLCAADMAVSLAACGAGTDTTYAGQTLTGRVTAMDGTTVTLALGEPAEDAAPSGGAPSDSSSQQPPEMPSGDSGSSQPTGTPLEKPGGDSSQPPEMPDSSSGSDSQQGGTPPEMPGGSSFTENGETLTVDIAKADITRDGESVTASDVAVDDILTVTFDDSGAVSAVELTAADSGMGGAPSGGFGGSSEVTQGDSANTISAEGTYTDTTYTSTGDDENALRIDGADVALDGITVDKSSGATSNTENGDFYGVNAALLATNGANVTITNAKVTSSAQNGNGVFSYGSGTTVNISNSTITTTADNSGGIQTTGGGTTNASDLIVTTSGNSSAAIRSDRGGGTWTLTGDCVITSLTNNGTINFNGYTITLADGTVLQ